MQNRLPRSVTTLVWDNSFASVYSKDDSKGAWPTKKWVEKPPKIGGLEKPPKMDGENNGKPYFLGDFPIFLETPKYFLEFFHPENWGFHEPILRVAYFFKGVVGSATK